MNRNLYLVLAGIFCLFATQTMAFVLIPLAAAAMGVPGFAIGVLVAIPAGLGLATDVLVAVTSDRLGRKLPILVGAVLGIAAGILLSSARDFPILLAGAFAVGLSLSLSVGPALAYVTEASAPKDAARVQGYNGAVQGLSALTGALAIVFAVDRIGPGGSSLLISVLMALGCAAFYWMKETVVRSRGPSARDLIGSYAAAMRLLVTRPELQLSTLVSLIFQSVVFVVGNSFLPIYIVHDLGRPAAMAGTLLAARNVAMTLSSPLFGSAEARYGLLSTILGANFFAVAGMVGVALVADPEWLYIPLVVAGFGMGFAAATANTLVTSATGRHERALGFATNSIVARAGSLVSPLVFGAVLELSGSSAVFVAAGLLGTLYLVAMAVRVRIGAWNSVARNASDPPR